MMQSKKHCLRMKKLIQNRKEKKIMEPEIKLTEEQEKEFSNGKGDDEK